MRWNPFRRKTAVPTRPRPPAWPLDRELLRWTTHEPFTLADACQGVQVWGMTGSGKSSGSGRRLALSYLRHGFGGLVLCANPRRVEKIEYGPGHR